MERWRGKVAVVTGASAGIGAAVAVALANSGMKVIAVARRVDLVEKLVRQTKGPGQVYPRRCDVADDDQVEDLFRYAKTTLGGVDVLVNNAAILPFGTITNCSTEHQVTSAELKSTLDINVRGVLTCTRLAVASMTERKVPGHVIFINSVAGHYIPQDGTLIPLNIYPATKHAITAISEVVRREFSFSKLPIRVTNISPGAVQTDMIQGIVERAPSEIPLLMPEDIAAAILYAMAAPQHVNVHDVIIHPTGEKY